MNSMHTTRQQNRIHTQIECAVNKARIRGVQFYTTYLTCDKISYIREMIVGELYFVHISNFNFRCRYH